MACASLSLYLVVRIEDMGVINSHHYVPFRCVGTSNYIDLRERVEDAIKHAAFVWRCTITPNDFMLLRVYFSRPGVAFYATSSTCELHQFAPVLSKMLYWGAHDWKVWHFNGPLPLEMVGTDGTPWIFSDWEPLRVAA